MKCVLGRKKSISNGAWLSAVQNIESLITREEVESRELQAVERISAYVSKYGAEKLAYGWSGGKDSIVLSEVCRKGGVQKGFMITSRALEYPAFNHWVGVHLPKGVELIDTGHNLEWLAKNQDWLFPKTSKESYKWMEIRHLNAMRKLHESHSLTGFFLGRRTIDGNVTHNGALTDKKGRIWINPIFDWEHEVVIGYIHYYKLAVPPIYTWKDGYVRGTHLWACRPGKGRAHRQVWMEIYDIDPSIPLEASNYIPEAKEFLKEVTG